MSPYNYCMLNPLVMVDEDGRVPIETIWDIGNILYDIGAAICNHIKGKHEVAKENWRDLGLDAAATLIPYVPAGASKVVKVGKVGEDAKGVVENADVVVKNLDEAVGVANKEQKFVDKSNDLHRPYIRKSTREAVEANARKTPDGKFIDPNTRMPIEGKYDLGHKYGREFRTEKAKAQKEGLTQKEFNDRMNDPSLYQIEDPHSNRSHKFEAKKR